jgi:hypothetical protein
MLNILLSSLNELPSIVVYACSVSAKAAFQGIQDVVLAADDAFFAPLLYAHHLLSFIPQMLAHQMAAAISAFVK